MFILLVTCISFILLLNSFPLKPLLDKSTQPKIQTPITWPAPPDLLAQCAEKLRLFLGVVQRQHSQIVSRGSDDSIRSLIVEEEDCILGISLRDLPELVLDSILERLSPAELCCLSKVCSWLRDRCRSDHLWEGHMKRKWGGVISSTAYREWQYYKNSSKRNSWSYLLEGACDYRQILGYFPGFWPFSLYSFMIGVGSRKQNGFLPFDNSVMAWYSSLQSGKYWFPAQVYNRENGHGFMLSCYDAELSYNSTTDTFRARYSPNGTLTVEEKNISWDRLRIPPVNTPPFVLHDSDCLDDLKPGDHFEIQWRRNGDYPYGWWYGVVGHSDMCNGNEGQCDCHQNDMVLLEFKHFPLESRWRRTRINRMSHFEEGNEADGFYGGIRKLYDKREILMWKSIWPDSMPEPLW